MVNTEYTLQIGTSITGCLGEAKATNAWESCFRILDIMRPLSKGQIRKAYRGIMTFMSGLSKYLGSRNPDSTVSTCILVTWV